MKEEGKGWDLNEQERGAWIERDGDSSIVAIPLGGIPGGSEASENIDSCRVTQYCECHLKHTYKKLYIHNV